uniref:Uncharacterized protein n=1 Tax=Aegilops tauschii subsp. strangulata TaxID=200361 RepID=A0A453IXK0_AEGTS
MHVGPLISQSTSSKQILDECLSSNERLVKELASNIWISPKSS